MESIKLYIKESYDELINNVTWPTWPDLFAHTRIVVIATIIFAIVAFLLDSISNTVLTAIYGLKF